MLQLQANDNEGVLCIPPKLQHYWNLTIRLFSVISRTLVEGGGGVLLLCRGAVGVFYAPPPTAADWAIDLFGDKWKLNLVTRCSASIKFETIWCNI